MIFHALLVGQHTRPVKLIDPHRGEKFPAMFGNKIFWTILTSARHMYASCMDDSCREAGESRPYPPILPLRSNFTLPNHPCLSFLYNDYQVPFLREKWPGQ